MTTDVRLLSTYKGFPPQSIISLPDAEATSLVSVSHASLTLTGGTRRYQTIAPRDTAAQKLPIGLHTVTQNQQMNVLIPEGQTVTLTGDSSAAATVTRNGSTDAWVIGAGAVRTIGPYIDQQVLVVQCTAGTVTAENHATSASAPTWDVNANGGVGGLSFRGTPVKTPPVLKNFGASVCDWQTSTGALTLSAGTGATAALDTSVQLFGKPTLKCTFSSAASDTFIATFTPTSPVRLRDIKTLQIPILFTNNQTANGGIGANATPLQVWLGTSNGKSIRAQCRFEYLQSGAWTTLSFSRATAYITNNTLSELDAAGVTITTIKIVQATNATAANSNPVWIGEIRADTALDKGRVSIVMDGEYQSQYDTLFPLMKANNLRSSLAIVTSQIGVTGALPCMSVAQINEMYKAGHEVINHTYEAAPGTGATKTGGYGNATQWPAASDIAEDIRAQWAFMKSQGWTRGVGYGVWGYTYGFDPALSVARQAIVSAGLKNAGVQAMRKSTGYAGETTGGVIPPLCNVPVDPLVIGGAIQISSTNTAADVKAVIDQAEATGQWCIITVHRASETPSGLEMTPANFADWMTYLKQRVDAGGVICAPFGETYNELFKTR